MRNPLPLILLLLLYAMPLPAAGIMIPGLRIVPDRADFVYSLGDSAAFRVSFGAEAPASLSYRFSEDDTRVLEEGVIEKPRDGLVLNHSLGRPGLLRLDLKAVSGSDTAREATAVGFSVEAIRPCGNAPSDWRQFWQQGLGEVSRVPIDPQVNFWKEQEQGIERYLVSLANIEGSRIFGWLSVPAGKGPFPAVVYIQGAPGGMGEYQTDPQSEYARRGMIVLALNPHGIELGREENFYRALLGRGIPGSAATQGAEDPYRYYFRRVVLGAVRAFDYLCSRPDVDTTLLAVAGASQGGGLSLLTAAVDRRVRAVAVHVPAMCDYSGALYNRPTGWPHLLERREMDPRVIPTLGYFDAALAAGFIRVPAFFTVSLLDQSCPPTTVFAAYNNLKGPREIVRFPNTTHPGSFTVENDRLLISNLEEIFRGLKTDRTKIPAAGR